MSEQPAILKGMRLVELSAFVAAPLGGMTLAQMGAEVIRIDRPQGGLDYRRWPVTEDNTSLFWAGLNKHKRSVAIDIATPEGQELAQALICAPGEDAGMLLTNFPARGWLDYAALAKQRSDLIQLTIQGDRHGGSAVDYTLNPRLGLPYLTGPAREGRDQVVNHVLPAWDLVTGQMAAVGLLAAERHRLRSGQGQHVKLPLEDVALSVMAHLGFIAEAQLGVDRQGCGNDLFGAFGRDFVTADGQRLMVVGLSLKQWQSIVKATDSVDEIAALGARLNVDLRLEGERFKARDELAGIVGPWIAARPLAEVATRFDQCGVCWGRYQSVKQLVDSDPACSLDNPMFSLVDQQGVGRVLSPSVPLNFASGRLPAQVAPELGQHSEQVLTEVLGLDGAALGRLVDKGVVGVA